MAACIESFAAFWLGGAHREPAVVIPGITKRVFSATTSSVPQGRTLTDVAWIIRDAIGGTIYFQFHGPPNAAAVGVGLEGTNLEPVVDGVPVIGYVELTITDSFGKTSSAGVSYE